MRKDASRFMRWITSVIPDAVIYACYQRATKNGALEDRVSSIVLKVYQNEGIKKDNDSRQSPENHAKINEIRRFSSKKFDSSHDEHSAMIEVEEYSKPSKRGENQYFTGVMGLSYNPF